MLLPPTDPAAGGEADGSRAVAFVQRPHLVGPKRVRVVATAAPGSLVVIMARDTRRRAVGARVARAGSTGRIDAVVMLEHPPRRRVVLTLVVQTASGPAQATWSVEPARRRR